MGTKKPCQELVLRFKVDRVLVDRTNVDWLKVDRSKVDSVDFPITRRLKLYVDHCIRALHAARMTALLSAAHCALDATQPIDISVYT